MSILQELNHREVAMVLASAAERNVPLSITVRDGAHWAVFQGRLAGLKDQCLLVERPTDGQGAACQFSPGQSIGVSLKLKHHKYLFLATVAGEEAGGEAGLDGRGMLVLCRPTRMQRLQRRAYVRAAVPVGCLARASFWLGGHVNEPAGTSPDRPVWNGRVLDLSAGGFSVRTSEEPVGLLEVGDLVGARLVFGVGQEAVYTDASVRHIAGAEGGTTVGFQFLGLEHTDAGKGALRTISRKVAEYQAAAPREEESDGEETAAPTSAAPAAGSLEPPSSPQ